MVLSHYYLLVPGQVIYTQHPPLLQHHCQKVYPTLPPMLKMDLDSGYVAATYRVSSESGKSGKSGKVSIFTKNANKSVKCQLMKIQQSQEKVRKNMMLMPSQKISHTIIIEETVCVCVCVCMCACMCVRVCVYVCVHAHVYRLFYNIVLL